MQKFCGHCGSPLKAGSKFCPNCGQPVSAPEPVNVGYQAPKTTISSVKPKNEMVEPPKKKKRGFGKTLLILAVIVLVIGGAVKLFEKPDEPQQSQTTFLPKSSQNTSSKPSTKVVDERPPVVIDGKDYQLEVPASAKDLECEPVDEKRLAQLEQQGYKFVGTPLSVTQDGDKHVQLDEVATVSINIPKDYPKKRYDELVGVLITDEGPVYRIPDYYALREGVVRFETSHFCETGAVADKEKLREQFIERVALNGWQRNMDNKTLEPTWKEQLTKFANDHCLGENDLAGIAARELFADNDIVKVGMDIVNAHDMENESLEERMKVASENMVKIAETKMMAYFLNKLKEEETKKLKVIDELKSEKKGEIVFKTELEKINSRRNKIIAVLEDRFSVKNVDSLSTKLGEGTNLQKCYALACDQVKDFAKGQLESKAKELLPYVKVVQATAKGVEIGKKFWASTQMNDLYKNFEKIADGNGGVVDDAHWNIISIRMSTPKFLHDMSNEDIKAMLEERYFQKKEIERRKEETRKLLNTIETYVDLNSECLEKKHFDYIQRLTIVNNLMDRFRNELLDKDGNLVYYDDGYKRILGIPKLINEQLCFVINEYFACYPDQEKFYKWLGENGYNYNQLRDDYDKLDALLWTEKPQYDPEIHIVIGETLGAESGGAKYVGHTICLGIDGKPYSGWRVNIPNDDEIFDLGWQTDFPPEDSVFTLSQYKAIGMPNQVLVYENETAFKNGKNPIKIKDFQVDTIGGITMVELNEVVVDDYWIAFWTFLDDNYTHESFPSLKKSDSKAHVKLMKSGNFSITYSGAWEQRSEYGLDTEKSDFTISGNMDKITGEGTFQLKGNISLKGSRSGGWHRNISFEASGNVTSNADEFRKDGISCLYIKNDGTVVGFKSNSVSYNDKHSQGNHYKNEHGYISMDFRGRE